MKVKFIRNPWYDDHWDITNDQQKLGKTLWALTAGCDNTLSCSYHLTGLGLYVKPKEALDWLDNLSHDSSAPKLASSAVSRIQMTCSQL